MSNTTEPSDVDLPEDSTGASTTTDRSSTQRRESSAEPASDARCASTRQSEDKNGGHGSTSSATTTDENASSFAPTDLIERPELSLEDMRGTIQGNVQTCFGRGKETAAVRGYNTERFAQAVFGPRLIFTSYSDRSWYDTFTNNRDVCCHIECKTCVYRYPSGPYGRFRIWRHHHNMFVSTARSWNLDSKFLYFFVVYTIEDDTEREVGKLVVPAEQVDEVLDTWTSRDHPTMGERKARDISWHQLLKRLGVPMDVFKDQPLVDLTEGVPTDD